MKLTMHIEIFNISLTVVVVDLLLGDLKSHVVVCFSNCWTFMHSIGGNNVNSMEGASMGNSLRGYCFIG